MNKVKVGIIGCGAISSAYLSTAPRLEILDVVALADLDVERAKAKAAEFKIRKAYSVDELLADPEIELVLNLTIPKAHAPVSLAAIAAGKHVYLEKPLGVAREEGRQILEAAAAKGVRIGCAPDTFLGAGQQTARKLIDDGAIGKPVAFTAFMLCPGHESWHPSPEFYYEVGGGPMLDMGPYYLTALINLLGPIKRIAGAATFAIPQRTITSQPKNGKQINIETPDHVAGTVEFEGGAMGTIMTSFATMFSPHPRITIFGTEGTMDVPDPNGFDGVVRLRKKGDADFKEVPHTHPRGLSRMVGVADMAHAIRSGRKHRASGELAMAVLDAMIAFLDCAKTGVAHTPAQPCERPAPMPGGPLPRILLDD